MDNISIFQPSGQRFNYHSMPPYTHFFALITPSHTWKFYLTSQSTTYWFTIYFPHKTLVGQRLTSRPPIIRPVVRLPLHAFTYPDFSMLLLSAIYGNFIRHPTPLHIDLYFKARTFFLGPITVITLQNQKLEFSTSNLPSPKSPKKS